MRRNNGMQMAAALCLMLGTFPVWYWYCTWAVREVGSAFGFTGVSLLLTAGAWAHRRFGFALERRSLLLAGIAARVAAVLLGLGGWFVLRTLLGEGAAIGAGILLWLSYLTAWEILKLPADRLLSVHAFILVCVACFVGWLLCRLQERAVFGDVNFLMLGANTALFCILRNRMMLLGTTEGRTIPNGFRLHNAGLLGGFLVSGAVLLSFRKGIAAFIGSILYALGSLLTKVFQLMTARFFQDGKTDTIASVPQPVPSRQENIWLGWALQLAVIGVTVFLVYRFRSELWDFLQQIAAGMFRLVRMLVLAKAPAPAPEVHTEYTDSVELLEALPVRERRSRAVSWQQYYRRYRQSKVPEEKFRAGYAFWMKALKHWHTEVPPNAVPARLVELSSGIPDPVLTAEVTEIYYRVRYGGHTPTAQELAEMDKLVRIVRKMLRTVHHRSVHTE